MESLLVKWGQIYDCPKRVVAPAMPAWQPNKARPRARQEIRFSLCDGTGVELPADIRIIAPKPYRNKDTTALFIVKNADGSCVNIARMDFWPPRGHRNPDAAQLGLPLLLAAGESHHHRFHDNARIGLSCFKPTGNIENAAAIIPPPSCFADIVSYIETEWNIIGATTLPAPQ